MATYNGLLNGISGDSSYATKTNNALKAGTGRPAFGQLWPRGSGKS